MTENKGKEYWTQEEIDASALTVALVENAGLLTHKTPSELRSPRGFSLVLIP